MAPKEQKEALLASDKELVDEQDKVGGGASGFADTLQLAVRGTLMMLLIGCIVWVEAIRKPFPNDVQARIPLVVCLFVFTINPTFGTAMANAFTGILGTFWACLHMWVMNGIFPGGMKEGMSPTSACAIFGWVNMLVFLWLVLWCKCGIGMKMFALATDIGFMLAFLDPKSTMVFSENFQINMSGTAVNTMIATFIACVLAPFMNLLPYPMGSAYTDMKAKAQSASEDMARLFATIAKFYKLTEKSIVIECTIKQSGDFRQKLDAMGGAIGAAWWERFDLGTPGVVRGLMGAHLTLMNEIYDRMKALLVAVSHEDFGDSHQKIMEGIANSSDVVVGAANELLLAVTKAASDGDISDSEKDDLRALVDKCKGAVKTLAVDFDKARRAFPKPISPEVQGESFFVVTMSAYSRLVCEYADKLINHPPPGEGFGAAVSGGISSTWSGLTESGNMNFAIKHFVALVICWLWSVYVDGWSGACVITAVFLISPAVCPDIQGFLNVMIAVIFAVVLGTVAFTWSCESGYGAHLIPVIAGLLWLPGLYCWFGGGVLALPALVFVALSPFRFVGNCPEGEVSQGARGLWVGMVANVISIIFVAGCQYFMAPDRASNLSIKSLDDAFAGMEDAFAAFWACKDASEPMAPVAGNIGTGQGYNAGAKIEPRFWRTKWAGDMYHTVAEQAKQVRLDILMLYYASAGSDGKPDAIFDAMSGAKEFDEVKNDLKSTLADVRGLIKAMLSKDDGPFDGLSALKTTENIDTLEALPGLMETVNKSLKYSDKVAESMEDDEICQISTVFLTLDYTIKHIAAITQTCIRNC